MLNWFWPVRTGQTFLDVWSIFHLVFWIFFGHCIWVVFDGKFDRPRAVLVCMVTAYLWEVFERYAEPRWPHLWKTPESFLNSYISDPLTCLVGILFAWYALDHWRV
jgi:hypothetical protein